MLVPEMLPRSWREVLSPELDKPYFHNLVDFVEDERQSHQIFPPEHEVFTAFQLTPLEDVKVVILGQDPYHDDGQAHGLAFSVRAGQKLPRSLQNLFTELADDLGVPAPTTGDLSSWASQGVLLLNAVLTVRAHKPNSHKNKGWEKFTDAVMKTLSDGHRPIVFVLWGGYAHKKAKLIDDSHHAVILGTHPSPLSARNGFFGSKPFSEINQKLTDFGRTPIDWTLP